MPQPIATILRTRRQALGLSQAAVADALGMQRPSLTQIESGRRSTSIETVQAWAKVLNAELAVVDAALVPLLDHVDPDWLVTILRAVPYMTPRERRTWLAEARLILDEAKP